MFHGVIHKITLAQFFFETRCISAKARLLVSWHCNTSQQVRQGIRRWSFNDGPTQRVLGHTSRQDGPSVEKKHCRTMLFSRKFCIRRVLRHTSRRDGMTDVMSAVRTGRVSQDPSWRPRHDGPSWRLVCRRLIQVDVPANRALLVNTKHFKFAKTDVVCVNNITMK